MLLMVTLFGSSAWAASMAVRARSRGVDIVVVVLRRAREGLEVGKVLRGVAMRARG